MMQRAADTPAGVRVHDLVKTYPGQSVPAVDHVSFTLPSGEMLALLGPSGCGKTTILRMIAGLIEPTSGSIQLAGHEVSTIPAHQRGIGMVFQAYALFPHMTVAENVSFGLEMRGVSKAERAARVQAALELVHLGDKGGRRVSQLSGGQQQRAALARSLVIEPAVLLLDEPLSNLDAKLRDEMRTEIREIQTRTGITTIFVTHDQDEALSMADRVALMSEGRIEQIGAPQDIYDRPQTRFVASFVGTSNFLAGRVLETGVADVPALGQVAFTGPATVGATVELMIRPHRLDMTHATAPRPIGDTVFTATVRHVVYTGETQTCRVAAGTQDLTVDIRTRAATHFAIGDSVWISCAAADVGALSPSR